MEVSPLSASRQVPHLRVIRDEERHSYDVGATDAEPPTVSAPDLDPRIFTKSCGPMAWAIYCVVAANDRDGIPNTYAGLADHFEYSVRQVMRLVQKMTEMGYLVVEKGGGRSIATTIKTVTSGVTSGVTSVSFTDKYVTEKTVTSGVTSPPTPPVVVEDVKKTTPPYPPKAANGHVPTPTYRTLLGSSWSEFVDHYRRLDPDLNEPWLAKLLCDLEPDIGPLSEEQLRIGLGLGCEAVKRKLIAERNGKEHIRSVRGLSRTIVVERLTEAKRG